MSSADDNKNKNRSTTAGDNVARKMTLVFCLPLRILQAERSEVNVKTRGEAKTHTFTLDSCEPLSELPLGTWSLAFY